MRNESRGWGRKQGLARGRQSKSAVKTSRPKLLVLDWKEGRFKVSRNDRTCWPVRLEVVGKGRSRYCSEASS